MPILIQPSFSKGEIGPALHGRVDVQAYQVALRTAKNVIIHPYGGASNRPGTVFIAPVKDHTYSPRLIPFEFKTTDKYILEFGDYYMRVIRNDAHVTDSTQTITGATAANPVVITANAHGFSNGDIVFISGVGGMTQLNGRWFTVANATANTFSLTDQLTGAAVNGSAYTAYTSGGTAARLYQIASPYAIADLPQLKYEQSADVMTFTHRLYKIQELSRTGHAAWTFTVPSFAPGQTYPTGATVTVNSAGAVTQRYKVTAIAETTFEESLAGLNNTSRTITGATAANPVVITANAHGFSNGDEVHISGIVGMTELNGRRFTIANVAANTFELSGENGSAYTAYSSGGTANQTFVRVTTSTATPDNTISWTAAAGAQKYAVYREKNGLFGLIGETELTTFNDTNISPDLEITPPRARDPFRGTGNYPGAVGYFEQRRVFGGSTNAPDTSYYSQTGNQSNMSVSSPTQADDAITATLASRQVNEIRHFVPGNDLIILTSGSEWRVNSGSDAAFEAATIKQKSQSTLGASHLRPIVSNNTIIFVEENDSIVRSFGYSFQVDGYISDNLSRLAHHMLEDYPITDWVYSHSPEPRVYMVRSDGKMLTMTFDQSQEVIGWTSWDTLGKFEAVATLRHSTSNTEDAVYVVVRRTLGSSTVRYIERVASRRFTQVQDCFFVDSGLTLDSPVTITNATTANPVVITATAHGFSNGDEVDIFDIEWVSSFDALDNETQPDQLNGGRFTVANATANTFELSGVDGSAFSAYVSGGTVRKAVSSVSGLWHLEGRSAVALADGNAISGLTVSNGSVTLAAKASRVHIGLKFIADIETLNVESPEGTIQGKLKKISEVTVRFLKSRGLLIGPKSSKLVEMKQREFEDYGEPTNLLTGDKPVTLENDWNYNGRLLLRQKYPLPMTILAVIPDILIED